MTNEIACTHFGQSLQPSQRITAFVSKQISGSLHRRAAQKKIRCSLFEYTLTSVLRIHRRRAITSANDLVRKHNSAASYQPNCRRAKMARYSTLRTDLSTLSRCELRDKKNASLLLYSKVQATATDYRADNQQLPHPPHHRIYPRFRDREYRRVRVAHHD